MKRMIINTIICTIISLLVCGLAYLAYSYVSPYYDEIAYQQQENIREVYGDGVMGNFATNQDKQGIMMLKFFLVVFIVSPILQIVGLIMLKSKPTYKWSKISYIAGSVFYIPISLIGILAVGKYVDQFNPSSSSSDANVMENERIDVL